MKDEKTAPTSSPVPQDNKTVTFVNTDRGQADIKTEGGIQRSKETVSSAASKDLHKDLTPAEIKSNMINAINGMQSYKYDEAHAAEKARGTAARKFQVSESDDYQGSRVAPARKDEIIPEPPSVAKAANGQKSDSTKKSEAAQEKLAKSVAQPVRMDGPTEEELAGVPAGFDKLGMVK